MSGVGVVGGVPVPPLSRFASPLPWDVHPVARVGASGAVEWLAPVLPREGACLAFLWRPGEREPFGFVEGRLVREGRGWRLVGGDGRAALVLLVAPR